MYRIEKGEVIYFVERYHEEQDRFGPFTCIKTVDLIEVLNVYLQHNPDQGRYPKGFSGHMFVNYLLVAGIVEEKEKDRRDIDVGNGYNPPWWYYALEPESIEEEYLD